MCTLSYYCIRNNSEVSFFKIFFFQLENLDGTLSHQEELPGPFEITFCSFTLKESKIAFLIHSLTFHLFLVFSATLIFPLSIKSIVLSIVLIIFI